MSMNGSQEYDLGDIRTYSPSRYRLDFSSSQDESFQFQHATDEPRKPLMKSHLVETVTEYANDHPPQNQIQPLGEPQTKSRLDPIGLIVLGISCICFALSVIVVFPITGIPWKLGYNGQLTALGILFGIEGICLKRNGPIFFVLVEHRFSSVLQNYDAILRYSLTADNVSFGWRVVIGVLLVLQIGLGAAYKAFPNGSTSHAIRNGTFSDADVAVNTGYFGMNGPPGLEFVAEGGFGLAQAINATIPFMQATRERARSANASFFADTELPRAYGYNTLLLSQTSVAVLDSPLSPWVTAIQHSLLRDNVEAYTVSADVYATITSQDPRLNPTVRPNSSFWKPYASLLQTNIHAMHIFNYYQVDMLNSLVNVNTGAHTVGDASWLMLSIAPSRALYANPITNSPATIADFQASARLFNTSRTTCRGVWTLTPTSIQLTSGHCYPPSNAPVRLSPHDQSIFQTPVIPLTEAPTLAIAGTYIGPYTYSPTSHPAAPFDLRASPFLSCTMAAALASMYWAHHCASNNISTSPWTNSTLYARPYAAVGSARAMRPEAALFVVLAVLPLLVLGVTLGSVAMYASPLGPGFGLVAVLAGVDGVESLRVVRGAGLSGSLRRRVRLGVEIEEVVGQRERGRLVRFRLGEVRDDGGSSGGDTTSKRRRLWKRFTRRGLSPAENVEVLVVDDDDDEDEEGEEEPTNTNERPTPKPKPNHRLVASAYTSGTNNTDTDTSSIDNYDEAASGRESRSESIISGTSCGVVRNNLENNFENLEGGGGGRRRKQRKRLATTVRSAHQRIERGVVYH